jgi:hypothetical protein
VRLSNRDVVDTGLDISDMDRDAVIEALRKDPKKHVSYASKLEPAASTDMILIINRLQIERDLAANLRRIDDGFWLPAAFTAGTMLTVIVGSLLGQ